MHLNGKTFLVTGGGSGLGAATVRMLRENMGNVMILDINETAGDSTAKETGALFLKTDVTDERDVEEAVHAAEERFGSLHGVVNCAGLGTGEKVITKHGPHSLDMFAKTIQVNLIGTFNVIRIAANAMVRNEPNEDGERGVIVNTASVAAFDGQIGQAAYSASKGGIVGMTLPIARELARYGVRVMSVAPGIFDTPMLASLPDAARESLGTQVPFPSRLGRPDEYAELVRSIFTNCMLNGEVIRLDGAIRMAPR
ncbi:3-hydroxyacyl-CoA dehydrogenase [Alicyclobacillus sp. SO9]|uniref:3-hydroxyacyl-CoA dehydrogenase n=1 Tax=Alicyclobacillus sp. SO9 TaxID=2665646 RepID=UPI0018E8435B|nr:3-hydroxyacyl-CoA dehydrogenase [Alicyclobacillus sp. SO9]QQE81240.1 3-hydroxyacyl-CoA dehydrogenase [Alicyclobacillus sp. SO9]